MNIKLQPTSEDTLIAKYFLKSNEGELLETTVDHMDSRVATAIASVEKDPKKWYPIFKDAMTYFTPAGRIMSNAGATDIKDKVSLINCTVSGTIEDSMEGIYQAVKDAAVTLKFGCGIGYEFSTLRPKGSMVMGAGASTSGPLSFMDSFDFMCGTVASAGARRGAQMGTMDISHPDVISFIKAKRENGKLRNFNLSVLITDEFMEAVKNNSIWNFTWQGKIHSSIPAIELWDTIMKSTYDFSEPGFILIDKYNKYNNLWFCENIRATNPCLTGDTKITVLSNKIEHEIQLKDAKENDLVKSFNIDTNTVEFKKITFSGLTRKNAELIKLELENGIVLRLTPDHKVFTSNRGYIEAKDLTVEDDLVYEIDQSFEDWKLNQDLSGWKGKYDTKMFSASNKGLKVLLTFEEFLFKAFEAKLKSFNDNNQKGYHLARINDEGDYTVESCRFLWYTQNYDEREEPSRTGINNGNVKLTENQVIDIWYSNKSESELLIQYPQVGPKCFGLIKRSVTWNWLTKDLPLTHQEYLNNVGALA